MSGKQPAVIFLITSKCFITVSVGMVLAIRCHRQNMKTSIINGSEVSRLSVAIQCVIIHSISILMQIKYSQQISPILLYINRGLR